MRKWRANWQVSWTSTNTIAIIARQSLALSRRILHVAPKTIRGKVLAYLSGIAEWTGKREFDIPFDRQQLADNPLEETGRYTALSVEMLTVRLEL